MNLISKFGYSLFFFNEKKIEKKSKNISIIVKIDLNIVESITSRLKMIQEKNWVIFAIVDAFLGILAIFVKSITS